MTTLIQDVRYGIRMIRKAPGFSAVAIASLAVGIGASTVLFSFANSFLFRPVHAARAQELVELFTSDFGGGFHGGSSYADYESFREVPVFGGLLAAARVKATLSDRERPEVVPGLLVSGNYFDVIGLPPALGRFFAPEESRTPGTHPVVVISHDAWRRRFAAEPAIVGRAIELSGHAFTVIGVGPVRFAGTSVEEAADFFVPAMMQQALLPGTDLLRDRRHRAFTILGRLKKGATLSEASAALAVTAGNLLQEDPVVWHDQSGRGRVVTVLPETTARFASSGPGTVLSIFSSVMAGVVALLAIACVNVATVLLARATTRRKEIAVRLAMGAARSRVVRQLLTECALIAVAGGSLGLAIAQSAAALFSRFRPDGVPPFDLTLDARILLFSIGASLLTVVLFGLAPALQTTRPDLNAELKGTAGTVRVRGLRFGLRAGLVVTQVAVSLALMVGAALMLRSAHAGRVADPGFRRDAVLNVGIDLSTVDDRRGGHARFYEDAVSTVASLPGVENVAVAALVPMDGSNMRTSFRVGDGPSAFSTSTDINMVGPGYFAVLDIPVTQGREFRAFDRASSPMVALVNETMARQAWNGDAIGKTLTVDSTGDLLHVVGVVRDLRHRSFSEEPLAMVYFNAHQSFRARMTLHLRTAVPAGVMGPALERTLHEIDRAAGLTPTETMHQYFDRVTMPQRLGAGAAMVTGLLELALAVMALYGVIAFSASQRTREIGLRMALGASSRSVVALVMREGLVLTTAGVVIGTGVALVAASGLGSMLIGVRPADPVSFAASAVTLLLVGAAASYVPARRASAVDPSAALRSE